MLVKRDTRGKYADGYESARSFLSAQNVSLFLKRWGWSAETKTLERQSNPFTSYSPNESEQKYPKYKQRATFTKY